VSAPPETVATPPGVTFHAAHEVTSMVEPSAKDPWAVSAIGAGFWG
jgi:hypothetical protein